MDRVLTCRGDCMVISGEGITAKELETLKEKIGESVFSELEELKNQVEDGVPDDNDVLKFLVGMFTHSVLGSVFG